MKLPVFVILLSVTVMILSVHYSDAQVSSTTSSSTNPTPGDLSAGYYKQGNALFDQGNYTSAIFYYDKAITIDPTNMNAVYNKALSLDRLGRTDEAIFYYDKVLANNPSDTYSLNNKGLALDSLGKHDEAISSYDKVLAINANDTDALYNKGVALDSLGKHDEAITYYDKVLAINPTDTGALNKLNLTYNNIDKTQASVIQKTDQTSLMVVVGLFIVIAGTIIVINLVAKSRKRLNPEVLHKDAQMAEEKSGAAKIQDDDDWKGI